MHLDRFVLPRSHPLAGVVDAIFHVHVPRPGYAHEVILPKGNIDLLINLGDAVAVTQPSQTTAMASGEVKVTGMQTGAIHSAPTGALHLLGISLRAESAASILHGVQAELTDQQVDGPAVVRGIDTVFARAVEAPTFAARCTLLLDWVTRRRRDDDRAQLLEMACRTLRHEPTMPRISALARELNLSPRHFQRMMRAHLGLAPSEYVRLARFARAVTLMRTLPRLTDVAHAAAYADQPHLCRDFRDIAGLTPDEYRRGLVPSPGHLFVPAPAAPAPSTR